MKKYIYLMIFICQISTYASIAFENSTPSIPLSSDSIGEFTLDAKVQNTTDLLLGYSFKINVPDTLPNISIDDIDDGKIYVSYEVFDIEDNKYVSSPGLRVTIDDREIDVLIVSRLYAVGLGDEFNTIRELQVDDYIRFTFSATKDIKTIANSKYADILKFTFESDDISLIDNSNAITTPQKLLSITNPAIELSKEGLGANSNLNLKFNSKDGIQKDTRIEIVFPDNFNISDLKNYIDNIYINQKAVNKETSINDQRLSFILEEEITDESIELNIFGNKIINPLTKTDFPFKLNIYINDDDYTNQYSDIPSLDRVFYDDVDGDLAYSKNDKIIIHLYKEVLVSTFTNKANIILENEVNGTNFGSIYSFSATNRNGSYASRFAITLGNDFNISLGLNVAISASAIITSENIRASEDMNFTIPSFYDTNFNDSIEATYDKLYANNDIDILYNELSDSNPSVANTQSLTIIDEDNSATYSQGDKIQISFSQPVDYSLILKTDSINLPFSDTDLGKDFSISLTQEKIFDEDFYQDYTITLGSNPKIVSNSQFSYLKSRVVAQDGSYAISDVIFSNFPTMARPQAKSSVISFSDTDRNGLYSSGDFINLSFTQNISPPSITDINALNDKIIDANFISIQNSSNGFASEFSIKLGDDTDIEGGDIIEISSDKVINEYGTLAGSSTSSVRFNIPDITVPNVEVLNFNHDSMQAYIEFSTDIYENNSSVEDSIFIVYGTTKKTIRDLGVSYTITDISNGSGFLLIDFADDFLNIINTDVFSIIITQDAFVTDNGVGNPRFSKILYRPTRIIDLIPNAWNLIAIQDNGTDTNIKNVLATNKIDKIWVFNNGQWVNNEDTIIQRGFGFWVVPKNNIRGVENIETIPAINENFVPNSSVLRSIVEFNSDTSSPLGNSVFDCDDTNSKVLIDDILFSNTPEHNITVFIFDTLNSKWVKNKDIFPCEGFLISTTGAI